MLKSAPLARFRTFLECTPPVIAASKYEYEAEAALYLTDNLAPIPACSSAYTANFWGGAGQNQDQLSDYDAVAVTKPEPSSSPLGCPTPESVHSNCSGSEMADSPDNAANNSSFLLQASSSPDNGSSRGKGGKGKGE